MTKKGTIATTFSFLAASVLIVFAVNKSFQQQEEHIAKSQQNQQAKQEMLKSTEKLAHKQLKDGEYTASAAGYEGDVTLKVTIKNGKIVAIDVISQSETPEYWKDASAILPTIILKNTFNVDSITGATVTSDAIKIAVYKALLQAGAKPNADVKKLEKERTEIIKTEKKKNDKAKAKALANPISPSRIGLKFKNIKDGTYYGVSNGYNGPVKVAVSVKNGAIIGVSVISHNEDAAYFNLAYSVVGKILRGDSNVDTVSGATYTSNAILVAVNRALANAGAGSISNTKENVDVIQKPQLPNINKPTAPPHIGLGNNQKLKDGVYYGSAEGYTALKERNPSKALTVAVTIKNGAIVDISVVKNFEDDIYYSLARSVINKIIRGDKHVDTVSGATYTSNAILVAVNRALAQAGANSISNATDIHKAPEVPKEPDKVAPPVVGNDSNKKLANGKYIGTGRGYAVLVKNRPLDLLKLEVVVENGKIKTINIIDNYEDLAYFNPYARPVISKIINGDKDLDTVTGATYSRNAIINAVNNALSKAGVDAISPNVPDLPSVPSIPDKPDKPDVKPPVINNDPDKKLQNGTFTGTGKGFDVLVNGNPSGLLKVEVVITDGKITAINILENTEDRAYLILAKAVIPKIINGEKNIDTITHATYSSNAILMAVNEALAKAGIDAVADPKDNINNNNSAPLARKITIPAEVNTKVSGNLKDAAKRVIDTYTVKTSLNDGKYHGRGTGYYNSNISSTVKVKNHNISEITIPDGFAYYTDDILERVVPYKSLASKVTLFLKGEDGLKNLAIMNAYRDYYHKILAEPDKNREAKIRELLGEDYLKIARANKDLFTTNQQTGISNICSLFFAENFSAKTMLDSVTGATASAGGIANSVYNATQNKVNNTNVSNIKIVLPDKKEYQYEIRRNKWYAIKTNHDTPLNLSDLKVELVNDDGSTKLISYDKFDEEHIELTFNNNIVTNGMSLKNIASGNIIVTYKPASISLELPLVIDNYSTNYIKKLAYSLDGSSWTNVENPTLLEGNLRHTQNITLPGNYYGKSLKLKTTSMNGSEYFYSRTEGISKGENQFSLENNENDKLTLANSNIHKTLFVTIKFEGDIVVDEPVELIDTPSEGIINVKWLNNLDDSYVHWDNWVSKISAYANKSMEIEIVTRNGYTFVEEIENLPPGLEIKGNKIEGIPKIVDNKKEYTVKIKAKKGNITKYREILIKLY